MRLGPKNKVIKKKKPLKTTKENLPQNKKFAKKKKRIFLGFFLKRNVLKYENKFNFETINQETLTTKPTVDTDEVCIAARSHYYYIQTFLTQTHNYLYYSKTRPLILHRYSSVFMLHLRTYCKDVVAYVDQHGREDDIPEVWGTG